MPSPIQPALPTRSNLYNKKKQINDEHCRRTCSGALTSRQRMNILSMVAGHRSRQPSAQPRERDWRFDLGETAFQAECLGMAVGAFGAVVQRGGGTLTDCGPLGATPTRSASPCASTGRKVRGRAGFKQRRQKAWPALATAPLEEGASETTDYGQFVHCHLFTPNQTLNNSDRRFWGVMPK